jgi:predicted O-methyltransferase YrrM
VNGTIGLEDGAVLQALKAAYAPDQGDDKWHNAGKNSLGFGLLHYAFVRNLQPDYVLTIGSRYGFVPACIALALKANGQGRLHFVDANYNDQTDGYGKAYGGAGHWSKPLQEVFGTLGLHEWIDLFLERTDVFFPRMAVRYRYIYIDGNHSYEGVKYDCEQALERLVPGGILTFHDALVDQSYADKLADPAAFGIRDFLRERFPQAVVMAPWPGLAIVQPKLDHPYSTP